MNGRNHIDEVRDLNLDVRMILKFSLHTRCVKVHTDRAVAQSFSDRPLIAKARVRYQASLYNVCDRVLGIGSGFSEYFIFLLSVSFLQRSIHKLHSCTVKNISTQPTTESLKKALEECVLDSITPDKVECEKLIKVATKFLFPQEAGNVFARWVTSS
jgi:uncharacterized Fe-S cluster-containing radical SAM superfamily protein